jgi:hypothetical protein
MRGRRKRFLTSRLVRMEAQFADLEGAAKTANEVARRSSEKLKHQYFQIVI